MGEFTEGVFGNTLLMFMVTCLLVAMGLVSWTWLLASLIAVILYGFLALVTAD